MKKIRKNKKGSSMTLTLFFTVVLSIAGMTFMNATIGSVKNAGDSINKTRAFWTAETGVDMGITRLCNFKNFPESKDIGEIITDKHGIKLNGYLLNVTITQPDLSKHVYAVTAVAKDEDGEVLATHTRSGIEFEKHTDRAVNFFEMDPILPTGFCGPMEIRGDFFLNTDFWIDKYRIRDQDQKKVKFLGRVTCAGDARVENYKVGANGDYTRGIQLRNWGLPTGTNYNDEYVEGKPVRDLLDRNTFLGGFEATEKESLPDVDNLPTKLKENANYVIKDLLKDTTHVILKDSTGKSSPYIKFHSTGGFTFHYKHTGDSSVYCSTGTYYSTDKTIIYIDSPVMVRGVVKGQVTLATSLNKDVIFDRHLLYSPSTFDFSEPDMFKRIQPEGTDILAVVSGGDLYFPKSPHWDSFSHSDPLHICGVLYALGTNCYDDPEPPTYGPLGGIKLCEPRFKNQALDLYYFYGSTCCRAMKQGQLSEGGGKTNWHFIYDFRLQDGLVPPGIPFAVTSIGTLKIKGRGVWKAS
jgi:hypothetical protein